MAFIQTTDSDTIFFWQNLSLILLFRFDIKTGDLMNQPTPEKDNFVLYLSLATIALVGVLLAVKLNENQKFAPIKQQLEEENKQMNIRVIRERED